MVILSISCVSFLFYRWLEKGCVNGALPSDLQPFWIEINKEDVGVFPQLIATFLKHKAVEKYCSAEDPGVLTLADDKEEESHYQEDVLKH